MGAGDPRFQVSKTVKVLPFAYGGMPTGLLKPVFVRTSPLRCILVESSSGKPSMRYPDGASRMILLPCLSENEERGMGLRESDYEFPGMLDDPPGKMIQGKRSAFILFAAQEPPRPNFFMAVFRLKASTDIHHHAAFSPKFPEGSLPPVRSSLRTECASSLLPHRS